MGERREQRFIEQLVAQVNARAEGRFTRMAALVRQRPGKGNVIIFITLEEETGVTDGVFSAHPRVWCTS